MKRWWIGVGALVLATASGSGCKKDEPAGTISQEKSAAKTATEAAAEGAAAKPSETGEVAAQGESAGTDGEKPAEGEGAAAAEGTEAKAPRIEGPVAKVNGRDIPSDEYYAELDKIEKHGAKIPEERLGRIKENILKRLIEAELIKQAIEKDNIAVPESEITKAFDEYKSRFKGDDQFDNYLKHGKLTVEDIKERIKEKRALELLIEKRGSLDVSDEEAQDFYEKNKRFYQEKEAVQALHILVKVEKDAPEEEEKKAMERLKEAQAALAKGEDFAAVAERFSEGPSGPKGGDLGFFTRGQMVKPFEDVAFAMKAGEVSEPVRTRFGYHIIKVLDRREESQKPFSEVKEQIYESLRNKKFFQERRTLLENLEKDAKIEKFAG
jgi:peptidyl-prolyl cis-trans isomerase C